MTFQTGYQTTIRFGKYSERLTLEALSKCLYDWLSCNRKEGSVISADGKTICGSGNKSHKAYHVVSAFVTENQLTLCEITTQKNSNEIPAVPELLDSLDIRMSSAKQL